MNRVVSASRTAALLGSAADRSPAYLGIADALRLLVNDGRIPAGTRLPSERELTAALGVSRTTVTRAYAELKSRGYLEARQGSGSVTRLPHDRRASGDALLVPGTTSPDVIDLTCAAPVAPIGIARALEHAVAEVPAYLSGTGYYPSGLPALQSALARWYADRGLPTEADQILVTSGALASIAVVARALVAPGDRVVVETPSYPNAVAALRRSGARVVGAVVDRDGWDLPSFRDTLGGAGARLAYLVPDFHNPTGALMPDATRAAVATQLRSTRTIPVVDETIVELALDGNAMPRPFATYASDTITVGSSSKSFWGGLRVGWIRAPRSRVGELVAARLTLDLGAPLLEQLALLHLLEHRTEVLAARRDQLRTARDVLAAAVTTQLPEWSFTLPTGGQSLWCELPVPRSSALVAAAEERGVLLAAGPAFAAEGGLERYLRLPFTADPDTLELAVERIADAWQVARTGRKARTRRTPLVA